MHLGRAPSFAIGLGMVPVLFFPAAILSAVLSRVILDLGRNTKYSFEATMDGPAVAMPVAALIVLMVYGVALWKLRAHVTVPWALCGTFVAPAVAGLIFVFGFFALGGQVGPR
jgi:hypothetical protein